MKKILTFTLLIAICLSSLVLTSCNKGGDEPVVTPEINEDGVKEIPAEGHWADAIYRTDKTFGEGEKTIQVEVKADSTSVTFTIKTNATTLEEALVENDLVEGDDGIYGLYIKKVNGILADYDVDQTYWAVEKNGEKCNTGASSINIADGEHYELVRTK